MPQDYLKTEFRFGPNQSFLSKASCPRTLELNSFTVPVRSSTNMEEDLVFSTVHSTVFKESESLEGKCDKIEGYDFNQGVNYPKLLRSMLTTGFQASNLGEAIDIVNQMVSRKLQSFFFYDCDIDLTCCLNCIEARMETC